MAYDPEAREAGNSAIIIGIVALVLIVGGALAYFSTRSPEASNSNSPIVVMPPRKEVVTNTVQVPVPVPASPSTVVINPPVKPPVQSTTKTVTERHTTTVLNPPSAATEPSSPSSPNATPGAPPDSTTTSTTTTSTSGDAGNAASGNSASTGNGY